MKLLETEQVDEIFKIFNKGPGCAVGILQDERILHMGCYGYANLEHEVLITPETKFDIASSSKQITAMSLLIASEKGYLSMDDSLEKYLPGFDKSIKLHHLVSHTCGLRDYVALHELSGDGLFFSVQMTLNLLKKQDKLLFKVGTEFDYCNTGYFLISQVIEKATGTSLREFSKKHIFDVLSMKNTEYFDDQKRVVKNRAFGYSKPSWETNEVKNEIVLLNHVGDGAILTSMNDFIKFEKNFHSNVLGKNPKKFIQQLTTPFDLKNKKSTNYAYGLNIDEYYGIKRVYHDGSWGGFNSSVWRFPDLKFSIVIFSNLDCEEIDLDEYSNQIADIYLKKYYKNDIRCNITPEDEEDEEDEEDDYDEEEEEEEVKSKKGKKGKKEKNSKNSKSVTKDIDYCGAYYCKTLDTVWEIEYNSVDNYLFVQLKNYGIVKFNLETTKEFELEELELDGDFEINNKSCSGFFISDGDDSIGDHYFKRLKK
jgi:CubicO group peptidase (beta-lactamase class C family)